MFKAAFERHSHESRIVAEAYFLLMAIDHLHRTGPLYERRTSDPRVKAAVRTFERDHGWAADLRDVVEHLEEYALGGGKERQRYGAGPKDVPTFLLAGSEPEAEVVVRFGTAALELKAAAKAAISLANKLNKVFVDALGGKGLIEPPE